MFQEDSLSVRPSTVRHSGQLTPQQVLRQLPGNATPAQQDSAIQQHIKASPIHWSNRPDTLHLPGQPVSKSFRNIDLPKYYKESFFSGDSLFHPELPGGRRGVAGDPIPYSISGDNLITSLLLGCFVLAMIAFANSRQFIIRQVKTLFYVPRENTTIATETASELRFQLFLVLQTCLLFSILYFFYIRAHVSATFIIEQYEIIGIYAGIIATYFLVKAIAYGITDWVFFDRRSNGRWMKSFLFLISAEGVLLFPGVMLQAYFNMSLDSVIGYVTGVVILFKLLSFYKTYIIFFRRKGLFLQIFLYFCALEILPLLSLWSVLAMVTSYLKINF